MKTHLPALLILLLGAAFYLHRREVILSLPVPQAARLSLPSALPPVKPVEPLPDEAKKVIEPTPQLVQRFEAELKGLQPELQSELRLGEAELEVSRWQGLLDWPAEQAAAVRRLATPKVIALAEARHRGGLSVQAFQSGIAAARADLEAALLQALGSEDAEAWQRAFLRTRERGTEDKVNASMRAIEDVISLETGQKDRLHEALTRRATAEPTGPPDDAFVLKVTHDAGILPPLRDELILAKDILTPEQMIQFDLAQESQRAMSKTVRDFFRRLLGQFPTSTNP